MTPDETRTLIAEARRWIELHRENRYQREAAKRMEHLADALEASLPVPDGDARERLINVLVMTDLSDYAGTDMGLINAAADAILAAFPALSRDIAGEIEAVANAQDDDYAEEVAYIRGLRRAAEIVRNGR